MVSKDIQLVRICLNKLRCSGVIGVYCFDRSGGPSTLEEVKPEMKVPLALDFGEFYRPIFTWGDTMSRPLLVATDLNGAGKI